MSDLVSWLEEQITEDERQTEVARVHGHDAQDVDSTVSDYVLGDPARVLAECAAKRKIIERVPHTIRHYAPFEREWEWCPRAKPYGEDGHDAVCDCGADEENAHGGNWFLRVLALPYADRPGYQPEWAL